MRLLERTPWITPKCSPGVPLAPKETNAHQSIQFTERLGQCPCQSLAHLNVHLMAEMVGLDVVSAPCLHVLLERHIKLLSERDGTSEHDHTLRSEEHTSELQSLMRISYAVFCLKKKTQKE